MTSADGNIGFVKVHCKKILPFVQETLLLKSTFCTLQQQFLTVYNIFKPVFHISFTAFWLSLHCKCNCMCYGHKSWALDFIHLWQRDWKYLHAKMAQCFFPYIIFLLAHMSTTIRTVYRRIQDTEDARRLYATIGVLTKPWNHTEHPQQSD